MDNLVLGINVYFFKGAYICVTCSVKNILI